MPPLIYISKKLLINESGLLVQNRISWGSYCDLPDMDSFHSDVYRPAHVIYK